MNWRLFIYTQTYGVVSRTTGGLTVFWFPDNSTVRPGLVDT